MHNFACTNVTPKNKNKNNNKKKKNIGETLTHARARMSKRIIIIIFCRIWTLLSWTNLTSRLLLSVRTWKM